MSNKTISMLKLRQVIRLYNQGKGTKAIAGMLFISRNTIKKYLHIFLSSGLSYDAFSAMSDLELSQKFLVATHPEKSQRQIDLEALLPGICRELKRKGVTKEMLYRQYTEKYPEGYGISRFCGFIRLYLAQHRPVMHIEHKAGDKMYIDFTGQKLHLDNGDGTKTEVEVFVAILGCSQLTYVEAVASQKKEDLIRVCENSLIYFEGVPLVVVPDNLRAAVTKGSKYEAVLNESFACFAEHYSMTVLPARAYKPRDKSLVEGAVKLIYKTIFTKLDKRIFYDLSSLNAAIRVALEIHNNTPMYKREYSRRQQFEEIERDVLQDLNPIRYELKEQAQLTVWKNGYIRLGVDTHYYSVPYKYIGKTVKVLYSSQSVEVYYRHELIAQHVRNRRKYQYTTNTEHLASQHQFLTEWSAEKFISQAMDIHEDVAEYIAKLLEEKTYPEQAYKSCSGILSFSRRVGNERLIDACRCAQSFGQYGYRVIEEILNKRLDRLKLEDEAVRIPNHKNIRGKDYYQ